VDCDAELEAKVSQYALDLTELLYKDHSEYPCLTTRVTPYFSTYHKWNGLHRITYGRQLLVRMYQEGYRGTQGEMQNVWGECGATHRRAPRDTACQTTGFEAIWRLVLHEFAHVIQVARGQRSKWGLHNWHFIDIMKELARSYPFAEYGPERFDGQAGG